MDCAFLGGDWEGWYLYGVFIWTVGLFLYSDGRGRGVRLQGRERRLGLVGWE